MTRSITNAAVLCIVPFILCSQETPLQFREHGELLIRHLSSAPFPHPRRAAGHTYAKRHYPADKHYSDSSVAIFIPMGYRPTDSLDMVLHLHGWRRTLDTALQTHRLPQQLAQSGKNAILVVPQGPCHAPDSYAGKLEDAGGLKRFVEEIADVLFRESRVKTRIIGKVILSAHSGGYEGVAFSLMRGGIPDKVREVYLFDALYGETEKFAYWVDHFNGKMINIYTDSGGTRWDSEAFMQDLDGWNVSYCAKPEPALAFSDLQRNRLIFIHSDLDHEGVVFRRSQFREFLRASCLINR